MQEKAPVLELDYKLNKEAAATSLLKLHFSKSRTKTIIQTVMLSLMTVWFIISAALSFNEMYIFLIAVCLLCIVFIFTMPRRQAKDMAEKFGDGVSFKLKLFNETAEFVAGESVSELKLNKIRISENDEFVYFEAEKRMFSVPKNYMSADCKSKFKRFLAENPQLNYKKLN